DNLGSQRPSTNFATEPAEGLREPAYCAQAEWLTPDLGRVRR
ncbi:hypothetical protein SAMN02745132_04855, partial [Enterovibrio nigricans DSM 22720]